MDTISSIKALFINMGKRAYLAPRALALAFVILVLGESFSCAKMCIYNTYDAKTGQYISEYTIDLNNYIDAKRNVAIEYEGKVEKYELDYKFETQKLKVSDKYSVTNYTGIRYGDQFVITGIFNGNAISRTLTIDSLPFYFDPKIGLMDFVLRGEKTIEFWGIRNDNLTTYRMMAKNMGTEVLEINKQPVEAVKIYWAPTGMGSVFFHRTYWFRKSDGLFLRSEGSNDRIRVLVMEKN